jgi:hypothetical protein
MMKSSYIFLQIFQFFGFKSLPKLIISSLLPSTITLQVFILKKLDQSKTSDQPKHLAPQPTRNVLHCGLPIYI